MSAAAIETTTDGEEAGHLPERRASWLELFFDLCFVVAVGAVAHTLHDTPAWPGMLKFAALFIPVWWSWMMYAWYATSFPEGQLFNRFASLAAMLTVLAMAAMVGPASDGDPRGVLLAFVVIHLIVAALFLRKIAEYPERRVFALRYGGGFALAGILWLVSLALPEPVRPWVWAIALLVDLVTPWFAVQADPSRVYATDGLVDRAAATAHIAERYGLFTIIVLGEAIIAVARGTAESDWTPAAVTAATAGFVIAAVIWWAYFAHQEAGLLVRGRLPAFIWGYGHLFVWAGIAMMGVGIEFAIEAANEGHGFPDGERLVLCGGLALYLAAMALLHAAAAGRITDAVAVSRLAAAGIALALGIAGGGAPAEVLTVIIAAVAVAAGAVIAFAWRRAPATAT